MKRLKRGMVMLAACAGMAVPGVVHADPIERNAENIRKLNIMLMVTSLRCRVGDNDFQTDYQKFASAHLNNLNRAGEHLRNDMERKLGKRASKRALDRIGVSVANSYGDGHPWLNCAQLKLATQQLAQNLAPDELARAADELLSIQPGTRWAG